MVGMEWTMWLCYRYKTESTTTGNHHHHYHHATRSVTLLHFLIPLHLLLLDRQGYTTWTIGHYSPSTQSPGIVNKFAVPLFWQDFCESRLILPSPVRVWLFFCAWRRLGAPVSRHSKGIDPYPFPRFISCTHTTSAILLQLFLRFQVRKIKRRKQHNPTLVLGNTWMPRPEKK